MSLEDSRGRIEAAHSHTPPWDIGRPQPAMLALLDEFPPVAPVFEPGCGTGELTLEIARRRLAVLGVDVSPTAIERARAKAAVVGSHVADLVEFRVGDALHPSALPGPFGSVVDTGFFHLFGREDRVGFTQELAVALVPGGRYYLLGFAIQPHYECGPKQVRPDELHALFTADSGWRVLVIREEKLVLRTSDQGIPAVAAVFVRVPAA